ncbi:MAG: NADH:flavin oxidoreductase, partial [Pseudomonadota bacterium]
RPATDAVVVYDDDHYYMGSVMAELLAAEGYRVTFVTPDALVASWTAFTLEQGHIERRLLNLGVELLTRHAIVEIGDTHIQLADDMTGKQITREGALVPVTMRLPRDDLFHSLRAMPDACNAAGLTSVRRLGDCFGPATIAAAVYEGHRYAREFDTETDPDDVPFKTVSHVLELGG